MAYHYRKMGIALTFIILSLMLLPFITRTLLDPVMGLSRVASMYTETTDRKDIRWPSSNIYEVKNLIDSFKKLIDTISQKQTTLATSEEQYRSPVDQLPLEIWEEDWSPIRDEILALQEQGINLEVFAKNHPERFKEFEKRTVVKSVNAAAFEINQATSMQQLNSMYDDNPEPAVTFLPSLKAFLSGRTSTSCEGFQIIANGESRYQKSSIFLSQERNKTGSSH